MMAPELTLTTLPAIMGLGFSVLWIRTRTREDPEYAIELEKLIHCRFCTSLICEGARKSAFCWAWQKTETSQGEPGSATNP